jgi:hypothetical protein
MTARFIIGTFTFNSLHIQNEKNTVRFVFLFFSYVKDDDCRLCCKVNILGKNSLCSRLHVYKRKKLSNFFKTKSLWGIRNPAIRINL